MPALQGGVHRFISLEGLDGCGKSTQTALLAERLRARGLTVACVRDPGGTRISERVRSVILDPENSAMHPRTELLLYAAARCQMVREVVEPALARGEVVLADRFGWSSLAYQGYGRGLDRDLIARLIDIACDGLFPARSILLDVPVETMRDRLSGSGRGKDRIESEDLEFFGRVRQGYLALAQSHPDRFLVLDGRATPEALHERICAEAERILDVSVG